MGGHLGQAHLLGAGDVRAHLEVARVPRGGAVHEARVGGADPVGPPGRLRRLGQGGRPADEALHGLGEARQPGRVVDHGPRVGGGQGRVVGDEQVLPRHVRLGLLVVAGHDGVVGALEQQPLAVGDVLAAQPPRGGRVVGGGRRHQGGGDVVLRLDLRAGREVGAQGEQPPGAVGLEAHAQHIDLDGVAVQAQGVALAAVHHAHGEVAAPVGAPLGAVVALDREDELLDVGRDGLQEGVVLVGVHVRRREQLDDAAQRAALGEDGAVVGALVGRVDEAVGVVAVEDALDGVQVGLHVPDVGLAEDDGVEDRLGDLRLAAPGDGGRLVQLGVPGGGADHVPLLGVADGRLAVDAVARRRHVGPAGQQRDAGRLAVRPGPGDGLGEHGVEGPAGHQDDRLVVQVDGAARVLAAEAAGVGGQDVVERAVGGRVDVAELAAQVVAREGDRAAGVLLLHAAEEVGRVADLGLDLLLAVAVVVVRDDGDDDAALVAGHELEGLAVVVELALLAPAHAVAPPALVGLLPRGQPQLLLGQGGQVRGQDDAAGVPGPGLRRQGGVVLRQVGVAPVAEDALDEVQVGHEPSGGDEADLHGALAGDAGDLGDDDGAQQQGDEAAGRIGPGGGPGQGEQVRGGVQGRGQDAGEDVAGHGLLVVGDGQAALGDVEDAGRGAPVVARIVQDPLEDAVALDVGGGEAGRVQGQGQGAGQARLVEHEGGGGQARALGGAVEVGVEEGLDAPVGGAQAAGQAPGHLALARQDGGHEPVGPRVADPGGGGHAQQFQAQGDGGVDGRRVGAAPAGVGGLAGGGRVGAGRAHEARLVGCVSRRAPCRPGPYGVPHRRLLLLSGRRNRHTGPQPEAAPAV